MKKLLQALFLSYILLLTGYSEVELKKLSRITLKNYFYMKSQYDLVQIILMQ